MRIFFYIFFKNLNCHVTVSNHKKSLKIVNKFIFEKKKIKNTSNHKKSQPITSFKFYQ